MRAPVEELDAAFRAFVEDPAFSCLAGRGVVRRGGHALHRYGALGSDRSTRALARDLRAWLAGTSGGEMRAFVAVFPSRPATSEEGFERGLWQQLQQLHESEGAGAGWDPRVSDDPADPEFAFSFGGTALFVIGLHPASSRLARQFVAPTLVFNPHEQFDRLREDGRFERMKSVVREREIALQGSLNPNLADFGEVSEARQYSGREAERDWQCPFHRNA
ncbi:MAG: hypothetical protein JWO05_1575 [Gemmatimonadetes bacterium]|nr:hypothetical protein [Gemmatimonadota bacterium]